MTKLNKNYQKKGSVSTGRVDNNASTLDQLFGFDNGSKFGTLDYSEFEKRLDAMSLSEIQEEAQKINIPPIDDKERLKRTLKNEFRIYASNYNVPKSPAPVDPSKVNQVVKDLMKEGK
jgi:hypothetical protein